MTSSTEFVLRLAHFEDISVLQELIKASVRGLQTSDYSITQIEASLSAAYGIDQQLIEDQTYFLATHRSDPATPIACGGWSFRSTLHGSDRLGNRNPAIVDPATGYAKIRAIFVHPRWARRGIGSLLLAHSEAAAIAFGYKRFEMASTLTGIPLYSLRGYVETERATLPLPGGEQRAIAFMRKTLP